MTKQQVTLRFFSTLLPTCEIIGYVESCEPNIFSRDPEMVVSIVCPLPDFVAIEETEVLGVVGPEVEIPYSGSVPVGFVLWVENNPASTPIDGLVTVRISNAAFGILSEQLQVLGDVDSTKSIKLSTVSGEKYIYQIDGPNLSSLMPSLMPGAKWGQLRPGTNEFEVYSNNAGHTWRLSYFNRYGGL